LKAAAQREKGKAMQGKEREGILLLLLLLLLLLSEEAGYLLKSSSRKYRVRMDLFCKPPRDGLEL
jgi:hypothetical protein